MPASESDPAPATTIKAPDPKPTPRHHPYDKPGLDALGFLRAVMHDRDTDLCVRMDAANKLLMLRDPYDNVEWHDGPTYRIGGIPSDKMQQLFESFSPQLQKDLQYIKKCYELGIDPNIDHLPIKGHA
jgi:hypothetical protein